MWEGQIEQLRNYWPRTIWDFLALQLRIGLSLVIVIPIFSQAERLTPGIGLLLLVCLGPLLALIYIVDRHTLAWTSFLLLFSAVGALIGLAIAEAASSPFQTSYSGHRTHQTDRIDPLVCASLVAIAFWWLALTTKSHIQNRGRKKRHS